VTKDLPPTSAPQAPNYARPARPFLLARRLTQAGLLVVLGSLGTCAVGMARRARRFPREEDMLLNLGTAGLWCGIGVLIVAFIVWGWWPREESGK
jgi:hypothetical protein